MGPWTVHECTVHSWQSQLLRLNKKKKKKREKRSSKNVDTEIIWIQTVTMWSNVCFSDIFPFSQCLCYDLWVMTNGFFFLFSFFFFNLSLEKFNEYPDHFGLRNTFLKKIIRKKKNSFLYSFYISHKICIKIFLKKAYLWLRSALLVSRWHGDK